MTQHPESTEHGLLDELDMWRMGQVHAEAGEQRALFKLERMIAGERIVMAYVQETGKPLAMYCIPVSENDVHQLIGVVQICVGGQGLGPARRGICFADNL